MANNVKKDVSDLVVSTDVLGELFGYSRRRINQFVEEGVLERQSPGRFLLAQSVKKYIDFIKLGKAGEEEEEATAQYWEEKALHEKAKREMAELKLAKEKRQLHSSADVEFVMTDMLVTFRNRILSIPQKVAPAVLGLTSLAEITNVVDSELREALTELSGYDPVMFDGEDSVEAEDGEFIPEDSQSGSSASENNGQPMGGQA